MSVERIKNAIALLGTGLKDERMQDVAGAFIETIVPESVFILEPLKAICSAADELRFQRMLKGLSPDPLDVERKMNDLYQFVTNEERALFVSDCFRKALLSRSRVVCCIMGLILADLTSGELDLNQTDTIIMNALEDFTDYDIENLYRITSGEYTKVVAEPDIRYIDQTLFPKDKRESYTMTLELCCRNRITQKEFWVDNDGNAYVDAVKIGETTEKMRDYIVRARRQLNYHYLP